MRVLIAMRSLEQAEGGPITAAFGLARALVRRGHSVTIAAHDDGQGPNSAHLDADGIRVLLFPLTRRFWEHSSAYAGWLKKGVSDFDLVIINSLWISHVHHAAKACQELGVPYIIRPHGCLTKSDLSHHRMRKRLYWALEDKRNCARALFIHCTSEQEERETRESGVDNTENIPLGVDEDLFHIQSHHRLRSSALFVGRIAEKKGIDILIRALATPAATAAGLTLDVLGVDHRGLQAGLEQLADELGVRQRVTFHGHADAAMRAEFLARCGVFALPSKDENFGIAVAEAMAAALPVVITPHVSHEALVKKTDAGLVVERDVDAFAHALSQIASLPDEDYAQMGARAREAVRGAYSWDTTARLLEEAAQRHAAGV